MPENIGRRKSRGGTATGVAIASALAGVLAAGAILLAAMRPLQDVPRSGGTLRVRGFAESPKPDLDPASGKWAFITEQIYDGLTRLDATLQPATSLAEYWTISKDGRTYIFLLRKGVKFHDGRELTSRDVKFSLERLVRRETNSPVRDYFLSKIAGAREFDEGKAKDVAGFRCPNALTFEIQWLNPEVSALALLSMSYCKVLPQDALLAAGREFFYRPVGTGAFKFDSWVRSPMGEILGVRVERNPGYFGSRKPYLDAIEFSPYYTVDHFMSREIDIIPCLSDRLRMGNNQVLEGGPWTVSYLLLSCANPPFDRPLVRKALALAVDKEKLAAAVHDGEFIRRPTNNFIPPRWPDFYPIDDPALFDRTRARQMLEDMGYFFDKPFPRLLLLLPATMRTSGAGLKFADELESQLGKIEIPLTVRYYASLREVKDFRQPFLMLVDWAMDFPDPESLVRPLFESRAEINLANHRYAGARVDRLLEEAGREASMSRRNELFVRIEQILGEELPAVPLFSNDPLIVAQPYVRGLKIPLSGFSYLDARDIWLARKDIPQ
jgi:ABC-type transport system substrate-binding protein